MDTSYPTVPQSTLREGISSAVTAFQVEDVHMGWIREVVVKLIFKRDTPLQTVVDDRDRVRANYTSALQRMGAGDDAPDIYFVLDYEPGPDEERPSVAEQVGGAVAS